MSNVIPTSNTANFQPFLDKVPTFIGTKKNDDVESETEIGEQPHTSSSKPTVGELLMAVRAKLNQDEGHNSESEEGTTTTTTTTTTVSGGKGGGLSHKDYLNAVFNGTLSNDGDKRAASAVDKFMNSHGFQHLSKNRL